MGGVEIENMERKSGESQGSSCFLYQVVLSTECGSSPKVS